MQFFDQQDETSFSYLASLTSDQRDEVIATIRYVDKPKYFTLNSNTMIDAVEDVLNYSKLFEALSTKAKQNAASPTNFRTGDIIGRGRLGLDTAFFCVWLCHDIVNVPDDIQHVIEEALAESPIFAEEADVDLTRYQLSPEQWRQVGQYLSYEDWRSAGAADLQAYQQLWSDLNEVDLSANLAHRIVSEYGPHSAPSDPVASSLLVPRAEDGPHNDGIHHLYFYRHPSEIGYPISSVIVGSASNGYYRHSREYASCYIDPLLTHSNALYGALGRDSKDLDEWRDVDEFPNAYIADCDRFFDHGEYTLDDVDWLNVYEIQGQGVHLKLRYLFSEHCKRHFTHSFVLK